MMNHTLLIEKSDQHNFDFGMRAFLGLGVLSLPLHALPLCFRIILKNPSFISCDDLLKNIQIVFNFFHHVFTKFGLILLLSPNKILGTILVHTFCITRSYCKILLNDFLFRLSLSDIICTVNLQSVCTSCITLVIFSSLLIVEGCLVLGSSSTSSQPFSKCLCHSKICVLDITSSP